MSTNILDNEANDGPPQELDWSRPSLALVACDGHGQGCVIYTAGPHVRYMLDEIGPALDDIGLDDAPPGISVWKGKTLGTKSHDGESDVELVAVDENERFRAPTPNEWLAIEHGACPWNESQWLVIAGAPETSRVDDAPVTICGFCGAGLVDGKLACGADCIQMSTDYGVPESIKMHTRKI